MEYLAFVYFNTEIDQEEIFNVSYVFRGAELWIRVTTASGTDITEVLPQSVISAIYQKCHLEYMKL